MCKSMSDLWYGENQSRGSVKHWPGGPYLSHMNFWWHVSVGNTELVFGVTAERQHSAYRKMCSKGIQGDPCRSRVSSRGCFSQWDQNAAAMYTVSFFFFTLQSTSYELTIRGTTWICPDTDRTDLFIWQIKSFLASENGGVVIGSVWLLASLLEC